VWARVYAVKMRKDVAQIIWQQNAMESHYFVRYSDAVRGLESLASIGIGVVRERPRRGERWRQALFFLIFNLYFAWKQQSFW
jgi:hypothetical protein